MIGIVCPVKYNNSILLNDAREGKKPLNLNLSAVARYNNNIYNKEHSVHGLDVLAKIRCTNQQKKKSCFLMIIIINYNAPPVRLFSVSVCSDLRGGPTIASYQLTTLWIYASVLQ